MSQTDERMCVACRSTRLSRYNPEPLCGPCTRASRDLAGIVPTWLWDSPPMRAALARLDIPAFVAIFRIASGLSQLDLANLIPGWSQTLVCLTEKGTRCTLCDIRRFLAFTDLIGMPRSALLPLILGRPDAILECDADAAPQGAEDMDRREFSMLATGLTAAALLPLPAQVDRGHVRYLQSTLVRLRTQDNVAGGGAVLPQAMRHFAYARRLLDESDYSPTIGRELLVVTADLGIRSGWYAFDADNQPLARRLYEQSALLADSAGDGAQRAYLYANMVQQSTRLASYTGQKGYAREALRFAERATDAARHEPSPTLHALISLRQSHAHAQLDDEVAFRAAITTARRELDRGPHDSDSLRTKWVTPSEITGHEALGRAQLGAPAPAAQLYHAVLDDTARSPRDQALYRSSLAATLVAAGDYDQAISHGLAILPDLGTTLTSGRILRDLHPVREAANKTAATEFCDRFDAAAHALRTT